LKHLLIFNIGNRLEKADNPCWVKDKVTNDTFDIIFFKWIIRKENNTYQVRRFDAYRGTTEDASCIVRKFKSKTLAKLYKKYWEWEINKYYIKNFSGEQSKNAT